MIFSVKYTDDVKEGFKGETNGWFIRIRPEAKDDTGLLEHEKVHVWQFWRTFWMHPFLMRWSKSYRLRCEVEAYKIQLKYNTDKSYSMDKFAGFISAKYELDITKEQAILLLREGSV